MFWKTRGITIVSYKVSPVESKKKVYFKTHLERNAAGTYVQKLICEKVLYFKKFLENYLLLFKLISEVILITNSCGRIFSLFALRIISCNGFFKWKYTNFDICLRDNESSSGSCYYHYWFPRCWKNHPVALRFNRTA